MKREIFPSNVTSIACEERDVSRGEYRCGNRDSRDVIVDNSRPVRVAPRRVSGEVIRIASPICIRMQSALIEPRRASRHRGRVIHLYLWPRDKTRFMGASGRRFGRIYSRQPVIRSIAGPVVVSWALRRGDTVGRGQGREGRELFLGRLME